jgi:hypothetical protein
MGTRRALVIGSQCAALPRLSFLPRVAEDLARVLTDSEFGGCAPALPDGRVLLVDPTVEEADQAIETAFARASADVDTLLLAFVGHGEHVGDNFYLLLRDAAWPPNLRRAVLLGTRVQELLGQHSGLNGLVLLVDACHSGLGARQAAEDWPRTIAQAGGRFEMLTSADEREAAEGCFTATLTELLRSGEPTRGEDLYCADAKDLVQQECSRQVAFYLAFDGRRFTRQGDRGLWLGHNPGRRRAVAPLAGTPAWGQVEQLTAWFERTPQLEQLVEAAQRARCVALVGPAGQGKSALAAALARWELADDLLPPRFVHALAFAATATLDTDLARDLARQLILTVDGFGAAAERFQAQTSEDELARLGPLERALLGPLGLLANRRTVRLAVDGLDQLTAEAASPVHAALDRLASDPHLGHVKLVVTARPDGLLPQGAEVLELEHVDQEHLERYLRRRGVPEAVVPAIGAQAEGNWLVAWLLADLAVDGDLPAGRLPANLQAAYRQELRRAGSEDPARWARELRPVLAVLAAAGVGPVLPLALLHAASGRLDGPVDAARVRDVLVQLRGLVVRGAPGTPAEHVGVFHTTFAEYLGADSEAGIDEQAAHAALADAIDQLAPRQAHDPSDPLHRYAASAEAEHLWAAGRRAQVVDALRARESHIPAENLTRWAAWRVRIQDALGPDHPSTLTTRHNVAVWTGRTGEAGEALRLSREVLDARERVLGPDHPDTLAARHEVAFFTGESGDVGEALRLFRDVLDAKERVLGPDHPDTLSTRHSIAYFTGRTGDVSEALRLFREVLDARERVLGPEHPDTLAARHSVAYWIGESGEAGEALRLFREVLDACERVFGPDHPHTLTTLNNVAFWSQNVYYRTGRQP